MKPFIQRTLGLSFLLLLTMAVSAQDRPMEVIFKPDMEKADLVRIQQEAKANGLELTYTRLERKDERITALGFTLSSKAGKGTAETESLSEESPFGFSYDPQAGEGDAAFSVGSMDLPKAKEPAEKP